MSRGDTAAAVVAASEEKLETREWMPGRLKREEEDELIHYGRHGRPLSVDPRSELIRLFHSQLYILCRGAAS